MRRQLHSWKGFTLAELLVVVAIVGILVSVSIPVFTSQAEKSRETTDVANLRSAYSAARYLSALGEFTVTDADGKNPKTYIWEADYPHLKGSSSGNANPFFYDPDSGQNGAYYRGRFLSEQSPGKNLRFCGRTYDDPASGYSHCFYCHGMASGFQAFGSSGETLYTVQSSGYE